MNKQQWQELVDRYAPQVRLSQSGNNVDEYAPSTIDWYLNRSRMLDRDDPSFVIVAPTREQLAENPQSSRYLQPDNDRVYLGDAATAMMYAHIRKATNAVPGDPNFDIDIQYWFFYPYNGPTGFFNSGTDAFEWFGEHQGDWEHITVRVSNWRNIGASVIKGIFFAAHASTEGKWLVQQATSPTSGKYALMDVTHPIVYSAYHSHASYECDGTQWRNVTGYFVNDQCSGGYNWGPKLNTEIMSIDADVYSADDDRISDAIWLAFSGKWGKRGSPAGPSHQGTWANDGSNGYYQSLNTLAPFGTNWGTSRETTGIAFGVWEGAGAFAVSRNSGDNARVEIFQYVNNTLECVDQAGSSWGSDRSGTCIAMGLLDDRPVVAVGRNKGDNSRAVVYVRNNGAIAELGNVGSDWSSSRACTAIALGGLNGEQVLGVGRSGDKARFLIYRYTTGLSLMASGGESWGDGRTCTGIAFGILNNERVVGVGRSKGNHQRFEIHTYVNGALQHLTNGGESWGDSRAATCIAFGELGGQAVVGVGRNEGSGARFIIYTYSNNALQVLAEGGTDWGDSRAVTGIAFGMINGEGIVAVSRTKGDNSKVYVYKYANGTLVNYSANGADWGDDRSATCVGVGSLGPKLDIPVVGYGRSAGDNSRGAILKWE